MATKRRGARRATFLSAAMAVAVLAGSLVPAAGPALAQSRALAEQVAAVVNDDPVTTFDVRQRAIFLMATTGAQPTDQAWRQATSAALNALINERLQMQEARRFRVNVADSDVDRVIANQARQNGATLEDFLAELGRVGISPESFRDKTRAEIAWQRIISGRYGPRVRISEEQVDEAMGRIVASANRPQFLVSEIFLEAETPEEQAEALAGAGTLVQVMQAGTPFQTVAQQYSFATTAASGGDRGWITLGEVRPEVGAVLEQLQPGQISPPIAVEGGVMIVGLRERRSGIQPVSRLDLREMSQAVPAGSDERVWRRAEGAVGQARTALRGGCEGAERAARRGGVEFVNLGEIAESELGEPFRTQAAALAAPGAVSGVFRSEGGVHALVLCRREMSGDGIPTREELTDRMYDQELGLIARRYLRDLRREAAIELSR